MSVMKCEMNVIITSTVLKFSVLVTMSMSILEIV